MMNPKMPVKDLETALASYTVMYQGDTLAIVHYACLSAAEERTWANSQDPDLMTEMSRVAFCSKPGQIA